MWTATTHPATEHSHGLPQEARRHLAHLLEPGRHEARRSLKTKSKAVADEFLKEFEYRLAKKELGQEPDATLGSLKTEYIAYCKTT